MPLSADLTPLLRKLAIHSVLSAEERELILELPFEVRRLSAHADLLREGRASRQCVVLLDGYAIGYKVTRDGRRQILNLLMRGDAVAADHRFGFADHEVEMLTRGRVAIIPAAEIDALVSTHPNIARAFWRETMLGASIQREWTINIGRRDARARLAHLLCEIAMRQEQAQLYRLDGYDMPLTQGHLGDCTGLTPVHVNRMFQLMRNDGLITSQNRTFTVENWDALAYAAGFDERYLGATLHSEAARSHSAAAERAQVESGISA